MTGAFALPTAAVAAVALLAGAGAAHTFRARSLRNALVAQDLGPASVRRFVGAGLGPLELVLAVAGAFAVAAEGAAATGVAVAALGAGFLGFIALLLLRRPGAPCGCAGGADAATGPLDAGRALVVLAGGVAMTAGAGDRFATLSNPDRITTLLAGLGLAIAVDLAARSHRPLNTITILGREP